MAALAMTAVIAVPALVLLGGQTASAAPGCTDGIGLGINSGASTPLRVGDSVAYNVEVFLSSGDCSIFNGTLVLHPPSGPAQTLSTTVAVSAGGDAVFTGTPYVISAADVNPVTDEVVATADINATAAQTSPPTNQPVSGFTTDGVAVMRPETTLIVSANPAGGAAPLPVTYTYLETNDSPDVAPDSLSMDGITGVSVTDPNCSPVTFVSSSDSNDTTLDPGATWTYTCSETYPSTGTFTDSATATGMAGDGRPAGTPASAGAPQAETSNVVTVGVEKPTPGPIKLYADPAANGGNDTGNNCLLEAKPCATIEHAIDELTTLAPDTVGSVISLSQGTFNSPTDTMFAGLGTGSNTDKNDNVTIIGDGTKTIVEPTSCSSLGTVTDPGSPSNGQQAIVVFDAPGGSNPIDGVTVENMVLNGAGVAGGGCPNYSAGVIDTSGTQGDAVVGNEIQSGTTYGILTNDGADSTIISNSLTPVLCTTVVKGPNTGLNAGWTSPANLKVKAVPTCAKFIEAGHGYANGVFINGVAYCVTTSATKATLVITGTPTVGTGCAHGGTPISNSGGLEIATGATVIYNTSTAPFTQFGIACNSPLQPEDQATDCAMSDNTVTGGGTVYGDDGARCGGVPPVGIVATGGATANVDGNSVSDVADVITFCPEEGETTNDGIGIGLIPDTVDMCSAGDSVVGVNDANNPQTGHGNMLGSTSANDDGIVVSGNTGAGCSDVDPAYQVNANTVSAGNKAGIVLTNLGFGNGHLAFNEPMANNSVSSVTGPGIELEGVLGQTIGGNLASEGNSSTGNEEGLLLEPCVPVALHPLTPPGCATYAGGSVLGGPEATQGNLIENNTMTGNVAYGVLAVGSFQPNEVAGATSPTLESSGNTFDNNSWGTATNASNGTNPSEIDGAEVMDGTGWGGGCASVPGDCPSTAGIGPLVFEGPNTTFSSTSPGTAIFTLSLCNAGPVSEVLPVGTEITFNTGQPDDGGTFFVTKDAIITGNAGCTGAFYNLSLQAIAPADVGTLQSPSGQPYTLAAGDTVTVNANGPTVVSNANFYGHGSSSNTCTPAGVTQIAGFGPSPLMASHPAVTTPNMFGATDPPAFPFAYSTTLQASTGGVNATYSAC